MKGFLFAAMLITINFHTIALADQNPAPAFKEIGISVTDAYVPSGFDANSDVFVVVEGIFPNGCYHWGRADITESSSFVHEVRPIASVSQGLCLMILVPFTKEIHIGQLPAGANKILILNGDGSFLEKDVNIEH